MRKGRERKEALYSLLIGTAIVWLPIALSVITGGLIQALGM